jgi:hypothetical protein
MKDSAFGRGFTDNDLHYLLKSAIAPSARHPVPDFIASKRALRFLRLGRKPHLFNK